MRSFFTVSRFQPLAVALFLILATLGAGAQPVPTADFTTAPDAIKAVTLAVQAADLSQLGASYPATKVAKTLAKVGLRAKDFDPATAQALAGAVDAGLVTADVAAQVKTGARVDRKLADALAQGVANLTGHGKRYLGRVSDKDIIPRITDALAQADLIQAPELRAAAEGVLKQKVITGYNLKDSRYDPRFDPALSLTYGHSDVLHAVQLIALLRSEGLDALVQVEPKTSAFLYLKEWGPTGPSTADTQFVPLDDGNAIEYAREFDLSFEFATAADKARFQPIVLAYAKKNTKDQTGLIAGSWWQPLYFSTQALADYEPITNNKIVGDPYYAQSFSLDKDSAAVVAAFQKAAPDRKVVTVPLWVDHPFVNYLNGGSN